VRVNHGAGSATLGRGERSRAIQRGEPQRAAGPTVGIVEDSFEVVSDPCRTKCGMPGARASSNSDWYLEASSRIRYASAQWRSRRGGLASSARIHERGGEERPAQGQARPARTEMAAVLGRGRNGAIGDHGAV
jgi:hypothetical protein